MWGLWLFTLLLLFLLILYLHFLWLLAIVMFLLCSYRLLLSFKMFLLRLYLWPEIILWSHVEIFHIFLDWRTIHLRPLLTLSVLFFNRLLRFLCLFNKRVQQTGLLHYFFVIGLFFKFVYNFVFIEIRRVKAKIS